MPSQADLEALRRSLANLSAAAQRDLVAAWQQVDPNASFEQLRNDLGPQWLQILQSYGEMSATLGADVFEMWATDLGMKPRTRMADAVDADAAMGRFRWAIGTREPQGNLRIITDELVKQPARSTIQHSATASGGRWARVPTGSNTCVFCMVMASRGAVYHTKQTAGDEGHKYHGDCDCQPVLIRSPDDYPSGYDPDAYMQKYLDAAGKADSGKLKDILSAARQIEGTH